MMTYKKYLNRLRDATEAESKEIFIAEAGFPADEKLDADAYIKVMHLIYAAAHGDFKELVNGYKLTEISRAYGIPYRTLQWWVSGERVPPEYVPRLIAYAMISEVCSDACA